MGCPPGTTFLPPAGIYPGTGSSGENESAMCLLVPCVCVRVCCGGGGGGGISASQLFPRHGKEGGGIIPHSSSEGQGMVGGAELQLRPASWECPLVLGAGWKASKFCESLGSEHEPQSIGPPGAALILAPSHIHPHPHAVTRFCTRAQLCYNSYSTGWDSEPLGLSSAAAPPWNSLPLSGPRSLHLYVQ